MERIPSFMAQQTIRLNPVKKFRVLSTVPNTNNELVCLCDGLFFIIRIHADDRKHIPVNNPHFRLVLSKGFVLHGSLYGVKGFSVAIRYEDISMPSQIHSVKTEYVSRFHEVRKDA
jgi:hypothetical protein